MKKMFVVLMAFAVGFAVMSCKSNAKGEGAAEGTETESTETAVAANPIEALTAVVEKAQKDGANWSVDEWKDAYRKVMAALAPSLKKMAEMSESFKPEEGEEPDMAKVAQLLSTLETLKKEFQPYEDLMHQFDSLSQLSANGRAVENDKEFAAQLKKEFGLPEDM